jgi:hypothetical protein
MATSLAEQKALLPGRTADFWFVSMDRSQRALLYSLLQLPWEADTASATLDNFAAQLQQPAQARHHFKVLPLRLNQALALGMTWDSARNETFRAVDGAEQHVVVLYDAWQQAGYASSFAAWNATAGAEGQPAAAATRVGDLLLFPMEGADAAAVAESHWLQPSWRVPLDEPVQCAVICGREKRLVRGIDYYGSTQGLLFRQSPADVVDTQLVLQGVTAGSDYLLDIVYPALTPGTALQRFVRQVQTPQLLEAALAQVCGLVVAEEDTVILQSIPQPDGSWTYVHAAGVWHVPYAHDTLTPGTLVPQYAHVGGLVRVIHGAAGTRWWRRVDWSAGLPLDQLCPVRGLRAPDTEVAARSVGVDAATGKQLVEFPLIGTTTQVAQYWQHVRTGEQVTGLFLADVLGVAAPETVVSINPVEFFFAQLLDAHLVVVELRLRNVSEIAYNRARAFLDQHRLTGGAMLVLDL